MLGLLRSLLYCTCPILEKGTGYKTCLPLHNQKNCRFLNQLAFAYKDCTVESKGESSDIYRKRFVPEYAQSIVPAERHFNVALIFCSYHFLFIMYLLASASSLIHRQPRIKAFKRWVQYSMEVFSNRGLFKSNYVIVSFAAVFRLVTQRSSPQTAAFFRTTFLSRM